MALFRGVRDGFTKFVKIKFGFDKFGFFGGGLGRTGDFKVACKKAALTTLAASFLTANAGANPLSFETLQGNFTQTLQSLNGAKLTYTGEFFASVKNAFWHYKTPVEKQIYFSYEEIVIIDYALEQAIISKVAQTPNLSEILANAKPDRNGVYAAVFDGVKYEVKIGANGVAREIFYKDKLENLVQITLDARKDELINSSTLTPKIPRHFDILRSR